MGGSAHLPAPPAPGRRQRRDIPARRAQGRHHREGRPGRDHQRAVRQPAALHLPRLLPAGLQGQRQGLAADHPHPGRARARRRGPGRTPWSPAWRWTSAPAGPPACTTSATACPGSSGPAWSRWPATRSRPRGCCCCRRPSAFPDGLCNDFDQVGRYLMVQGAPQTAGRFDAEVRMYKAPPPEVSSEEFYETDPSKPYQRGFAIQTVSPAADHLGRARRRAGALGAGAARVHERLRALVRAWARCASSCRCPATGSRWPTRRTSTACRWPSFSYSQCDNDQQLLEGRPARHGGRSCTPRAPTR